MRSLRLVANDPGLLHHVVLLTYPCIISRKHQTSRSSAELEATISPTAYPSSRPVIKVSIVIKQVVVKFVSRKLASWARYSGKNISRVTPCVGLTLNHKVISQLSQLEMSSTKIYSSIPHLARNPRLHMTVLLPYTVPQTHLIHVI